MKVLKELAALALILALIVMLNITITADMAGEGPSVQQATEQPTLPSPTPIPPTPVQQTVAQEAVVQAPVDTVQEPVANVETTIDGINAGGDVYINVDNNVDSAATANVDANAASAQEQTAPPGDAPAVEPTPLLADGNHNCQNAGPTQYVVTDSGDTGIVASIITGTTLVATDKRTTYPAPQNCQLGRSAFQFCGYVEGLSMNEADPWALLYDVVFGVAVYFHPMTNSCPG